MSFIFPIVACFLLYKNKNNFNNKYMKEKFGVIYHEFKPRNFYHYMYNGFFFYRRIAFILLLINGSEGPFL